MKIVSLFFAILSMGCTTINVHSETEASSSSGGEDPSSSSTSGKSSSSSAGSGGHGAGGNENGGSASSSSTSVTTTSSGSGGSGGSGGSSTSSGPGGSGGGGGEPACNTCEQMLNCTCTQPVSVSTSCPGAAEQYMDLSQCGAMYCDSPCSNQQDEYLFMCTNGANNFCKSCLQNNCGAAFTACQ
jgi:hypothetical protein